MSVFGFQLTTAMPQKPMQTFVTVGCGGGCRKVWAESRQSEVARGDQRVDGQAPEVRRDRIADEVRIPRRFVEPYWPFIVDVSS